jgi:hypothetical protein
VVHVDGDFRQQYEASSDERKISTWSAKGFPDCIVGSPYPLNDRWGKGIRTSEVEGYIDLVHMQGLVDCSQSRC